MFVAQQNAGLMSQELGETNGSPQGKIGVHDRVGDSMETAADRWSITLHEQIAATRGVWLQSLVLHPAINR
jgi:hypothetical protein